MRDRVNREIDGVDYGLYPLNPFAASKILVKLTRYGAKPIIQMIMMFDDKESKESNKKSILDADLGSISDSLPALGEALELCLEKMPDDELEILSKSLLAQDLFTADSKKVVSLSNHINNYGVLHLLKLIKFGLEVNFKDFFAGSLGKAISKVV